MNDETITMKCGCRVTFLGATYHRSSRVESCVRHAHRAGDRQRASERNSVFADARKVLQVLQTNGEVAL